MGRQMKHLDNGHQQTLLNLFRCYDLSGDQCEYMVDLINTTIEMFASKKADPQPQITAAMQHNNWGDDYGDVYGTDPGVSTAAEAKMDAHIHLDHIGNIKRNAHHRHEHGLEWHHHIEDDNGSIIVVEKPDFSRDTERTHQSCIYDVRVFDGRWWD